jgi:DNA primase
MKIDDALLESIRDRADIVQIISDYLPLKKSGKYFKALCPFHKEKTPSFHVNPTLKIFHCFGCGIGGDVFSFLIKYENMEFLDSVKMVAKIVGVTIPQYPATVISSQFNRILKANQIASDYFQKVFYSSEGSMAYNYITNRGVSQKILETFKIGFCAFDVKPLIDAGRKENLKAEDFESAGVIIKRQSGAWANRFADRLIFPIKDIQGSITGFAGRALDDKSPKYLNSPQTPVYNKGRMLYGLDVARIRIREKGFAILVEGYMDVIGVYQQGIENVVASMGTSLTEEQLHLLGRFTSNVVFSYDPDTAGQAATLRGLDIAVSNGFKVNIMFLPEGKDPDMFVKEKGKSEFLNAVEKSEEVFDYKIRMTKQKYPSDSPQDKVRQASELLQMISNIKDEVLKDLYVRRLAEKLYISESILRTEFARILKKTQIQKDLGSSAGPCLAEKIFAGLVLTFPNFRNSIQDDIRNEDIQDEAVRDIFTVCMENKDLSAASILEKINDKEKKSLASLMVMEASQIQNYEKAIQDTKNWFKKRKKEQNFAQTCSILKEAHRQGNRDNIRKITLDIDRIVRGI